MEVTSQMEEIVNLIMNSGLSVVCVGYLIYFQLTTLKSLTATLQTVGERLSKIETKLDIDLAKENK